MKNKVQYIIEIKEPWDSWREIDVPDISVRSNNIDTAYNKLQRIRNRGYLKVNYAEGGTFPLGAARFRIVKVTRKEVYNEPF
jgi:hypothetical protein